MAEQVPIRVEIFESALKRLQRTKGASASFAALARKMKVPAADVREWRRLGKVPAEKVDALATTLNVSVERLVRTSDGTIPAAHSALLPRQVGHNLVAMARALRSYTRFLGTQRTHDGYAHHEIVHHGGEASFYGTLVLETVEAEQEWLFSVWFGLRMDYGIVRLSRDGSVTLEPILQEQTPMSCQGFASLTDEDITVVPVRTWFGRPRCDFVIHSEKPFSLRCVREPVEIPGVVTFLKNVLQKDE